MKDSKPNSILAGESTTGKSSHSTGTEGSPVSDSVAADSVHVSASDEVEEAGPREDFRRRRGHSQIQYYPIDVSRRVSLKSTATETIA